ncbi:DNA-directed RNA polymerase III subunit C53 [Saccharomyces eubayanus]|uniref:DNA-directed RNA polymerase III subunit C53 n=1 Tax=Saccharomyces eubayanus TaxID=1080349 RepID=UPI0006C501D3|nr:RPC53-like protein [Saccharomyces eubayanus]KOH00223.1 RPC53-like protein [Saccharomyces eubayanus]
MSSNKGNGRLPSLKDSSSTGGPAKPSLKFKPKAVARKSKEEREAAASKVKLEEGPKRDKKNFNNSNSKRVNGNGGQQRRMAKYLNNTHVISSGPLAAGNFVSEKGDLRRGFIKSEGGGSSLVQKGLETIDNGAESSDNEAEGDSNGDVASRSKKKFNMGREFDAHNLIEVEEEEDSGKGSDVDMDDEAWGTKRIEQLFPVRPIRVRHEEVDTVKREIQEALSEKPTREPTPGVKIESSNTELQSYLEEREKQVNEKLGDLELQKDFQSVDEKESAAELELLKADHQHILRKLKKMDSKPERFMVFQLPTRLPNFERPAVKTEEVEVEAQASDATKKKKTLKKKSTTNVIPSDELAGNIGAIRVHKSGKLSVKIGNVVMDIGKGAETTFLQDVVALSMADDSSSAELLGRVDGKIVVTPKI